MFTLTPSPHRPTVELHITTTGELSAFQWLPSLLLLLLLVSCVKLSPSSIASPVFKLSTTLPCNKTLPFVISHLISSWSPGLPDQREQACQTPKSHLSLSPLIPSRSQKPPRATGRKESKKETFVPRLRPSSRQELHNIARIPEEEVALLVISHFHLHFAGDQRG